MNYCDDLFSYEGVINFVARICLMKDKEKRLYTLVIFTTFCHVFSSAQNANPRLTYKFLRLHFSVVFKNANLIKSRHFFLYYKVYIESFV